MYVLYKNDAPMSVCYTKIGAKHARRHFLSAYTKENPKSQCMVTIAPTNHYSILHAGLAALRVIRFVENRKLNRLKNKEDFARYMREVQENKVSSLY